jgi:GTP-binding protein HflX
MDIENKQKVIIAGVDFTNNDYPKCDEISLKELSALVDTAGGEVIFSIFQRRDVPDVRTYIGEGKVVELKQAILNMDADLVVFDGELKPSHIKNLTEDLGVMVIDKSTLILDIFALHATTKEGKLGVELAQLKYQLPRLTGIGTELSRLGGGIGTRGPGETKLETDRRHIRARIELLQRELEDIQKNRDNQRKQRAKNPIPKLVIIGYTNAGKSTLLNKLTDAGVLVEDKLFATLSTTTRKLLVSDTTEVLLSDTVGFIRNLPKHLFEAFASTFDELKYADILLHVVDASDENYFKNIEAVNSLVNLMNSEQKEMIMVYNKCDKVNVSVLPFLEDSVLYCLYFCKDRKRDRPIACNDK